MNTSGDKPSHLPVDQSFAERLIIDSVISHSATLTPLTGGVSSDIYRVDDGPDRFVIKRALPKLRVSADWYADTQRNKVELAYLQYAGEIVPGAVPKIRSSSEEHGYFTMEWLDESFQNWKQLLLDGKVDPNHAVLAGKILGAIHQQSAGKAELAMQFATDLNFFQVRIEPYLLTTGNKHPKLKPMFDEEAKRLANTHEALVHGDFSPKNILIAGDRVVLLDCEVAWFGDPAFDVAFLFNHLLLKAVDRPQNGAALHEATRRFWDAYLTAKDDPCEKIQQRLATLVPMLMLARVDGKSPVEYLPDDKRDWIRQFTTAALIARYSFAQFVSLLFDQVSQ